MMRRPRAQLFVFVSLSRRKRLQVGLHHLRRGGTIAKLWNFALEHFEHEIIFAYISARLTRRSRKSQVILAPKSKVETKTRKQKKTFYSCRAILFLRLIVELFSAKVNRSWFQLAQCTILLFGSENKSRLFIHQIVSRRLFSPFFQLLFPRQRVEKCQLWIVFESGSQSFSFCGTFRRFES